jgi:hypothetical protein
MMFVKFTIGYSEAIANISATELEVFCKVIQAMQRIESHYYADRPYVRNKEKMDIRAEILINPKIVDEDPNKEKDD